MLLIIIETSKLVNQPPIQSVFLSSVRAHSKRERERKTRLMPNQKREKEKFSPFLFAFFLSPSPFFFYFPRSTHFLLWGREEKKEGKLLVELYHNVTQIHKQLKQQLAVQAVRQSPQLLTAAARGMKSSSVRRKGSHPPTSKACCMVQKREIKCLVIHQYSYQARPATK